MAECVGMAGSETGANPATERVANQDGRPIERRENLRHNVGIALGTDRVVWGG